MYDTGQEECWDAPDSFHTGLWRTRPRILEAVGIRPFKWKLNDLGTTTVECLCKGFARRVKAAGFDIATQAQPPPSASVLPGRPPRSPLRSPSAPGVLKLLRGDMVRGAVAWLNSL